MRSEGAILQSKAELVDGAIDVLRQRFEIWGGFHAGPEDARTGFAGEETEAVEIESDGRGGMQSRENFL